MYALALPFLVVIWLNQKTGSAAMDWGVTSVERARKPIAFWLTQALLGLMAFCCLLTGTLMITGVTPP